MNEIKEKSAVGTAFPATDIENNHKTSITDVDENINAIFEKLTELLQMTRAGCNIADIRKVGEKAVIIYINGDLECINIGGDSGITAVYDIVKKLLWR